MPPRRSPQDASSRRRRAPIGRPKQIAPGQAAPLREGDRERVDMWFPPAPREARGHGACEMPRRRGHKGDASDSPPPLPPSDGKPAPEPIWSGLNSL